MIKRKRVGLALLAMQRHSWEQGLAMDAFMAEGEKDLVVMLAKEAAYRSLDDGRVAAIGTMEAATDPCAAGIGLLFALNLTGDLTIKDACEKLLEWTLHKAPRSNQGILYHVTNAAEFWVDSMYMLPPYLAASGHPKEAVKQIMGYMDKLYDPKKHLMSHMWDDEKGEYKREAFWGGGNGWTMAGLVKVIDLLPGKMKEERAQLIQMATDLIRAVASFIRDDGYAHDILDDPNSFIEVNLPQMLSYSIYTGIASGWLDAKWKATADRCRLAANDKVDKYGLVQDVCGAPHFIAPGVSPEGQAFYLLMEAAADKIK